MQLSPSGLSLEKEVESEEEQEEEQYENLPVLLAESVCEQLKAKRSTTQPGSTEVAPGSQEEPALKLAMTNVVKQLGGDPKASARVGTIGFDIFGDFCRSLQEESFFTFEDGDNTPIEFLYDFLKAAPENYFRFIVLGNKGPIGLTCPLKYLRPVFLSEPEQKAAPAPSNTEAQTAAKPPKELELFDENSSVALLHQFLSSTPQGYERFIRFSSFHGSLNSLYGWTTPKNPISLDNATQPEQKITNPLSPETPDSSITVPKEPVAPNSEMQATQKTKEKIDLTELLPLLQQSSTTIKQFCLTFLSLYPPPSNKDVPWRAELRLENFTGPTSMSRKTREKQPTHPLPGRGVAVAAAANPNLQQEHVVKQTP